MKQLMTSALIVGAILSDAACGGGSAPAPTLDSGLYGTIVQVPTILPSPPPIEAMVIVKDCETGEWITTIRSDPKGNYRIALAPGHYCFYGPHPKNALVPSLMRSEVDVWPHRFNELTIYFDSGIR